jgi:DNA invertase Pin-like site-specific DNA recombinase
MSDKITSEHLRRRAVVYVRQSTPEQVRWNLESQRRQYELAQRATRMGWEEVEVIDEDLGRSGSTTVNRPGFQRLVAAVCLREVGAVFSLEASRLARNNRDWYQLVDICGLVGTLIIDQDGVYDPRLLNDRLLLGLKGTMSEFELGLLRGRALEALQRIAKRGELLTSVAIGYIRTSDNRCEKTPDLRVQQAIELVFQKFGELGSIRQVLLWLRQERIMLPAVDGDGWGRKVSWRLPVYNTVLKVLTNPIYAGAYAYGRTVSRTRVVDGRPVITRGRRRDVADWEVLILDHHEAYIPWNVYEGNQRQIRDNATVKGLIIRGPVRSGQSLIAGLLRCRRCGRKLQVGYSGRRGGAATYTCWGTSGNHSASKCLSFGGLVVDRAIEGEILKVVQPAAIEAALSAVEAISSAYDGRLRALELALRQARYEAERVRRQYDAADPENRLVTAELERRWNAALARVTDLETEIQKIRPPVGKVGAVEKERLLTLTEELPWVWDHPRTDMRLKKRIVRTLIEEIVVDVGEERSFIELLIHWAGGSHSRLQVRRNRPGYHRYCTDNQIVDVIRELSKTECDDDIARILNRLGYKTARGYSWTQDRVDSVRNHHGIPVYSIERQEQKGWMNMIQASREMGISPMSVRRLLQAGVLEGYQVVPYAPWIIQRDSLAREQVQAAVRSIKAGRRRPLPEVPEQERLRFEGES